MVELFQHVKNEQPKHIFQLIFTFQDPTNNAQRLKEKRRRLRTAAAPAAQQGQGIEDIFHFGKKKAKKKVVRNIGKMTLEQLQKLSGKVKNKRLKKILGSENVKNLVNYGAAYGIKNCSKNLLQ